MLVLHNRREAKGKKRVQTLKAMARSCSIQSRNFKHQSNSFKCIEKNRSNQSVTVHQTPAQGSHGHLPQSLSRKGLKMDTHTDTTLTDSHYQESHNSAFPRLNKDITEQSAVRQAEHNKPATASCSFQPILNRRQKMTRKEKGARRWLAVPSLSASVHPLDTIC